MPSLQPGVGSGMFESNTEAVGIPRWLAPHGIIIHSIREQLASLVTQMPRKCVNCRRLKEVLDLTSRKLYIHIQKLPMHHQARYSLRARVGRSNSPTDLRILSEFEIIINAGKLQKSSRQRINNLMIVQKQTHLLDLR